jgi:nitrate/nitrite-specific signal transduction histidine kinase
MTDTAAADIIKRRFLASYGVALFFLVAVSLGAHIYIDRTLVVERQAAQTVNQSGAQRMLSQRTLALSQSLSQADGARAGTH